MLICLVDYLALTTLSAYSADNKLAIFLLYFPENRFLTFHANCLPWMDTICIIIVCFLGKIRKIFQNVVCWIFYPTCRVLKLIWTKRVSDEMLFWKKYRVSRQHTFRPGFTKRQSGQCVGCLQYTMQILHWKTD